MKVGRFVRQGIIMPVEAEEENIMVTIEDCEVDEAITKMNLTEFGTADQIKRLRHILWKHRSLFKGMGTIKNYEHRIMLRDDVHPYCAPIRRRSPKEAATEKEMITSLVDRGVLEKSISPWAANNVFVPKRDGSIRCTSDFRALNATTIPDAYPIESVQETLDWASQRKIFSLFDFKDEFFQVVLAPDSRPLTSVRTVLGLFQYTRLAMGYIYSPAVFQRLVNNIIGDVKGRNVWIFMDDGVVGTMDEEGHIKSVDEVLSRLEDQGMKLKIIKCQFGTRHLQLLGHQVTPDGLLPSQKHIEGIRNLRIPTNGTDLLRFIGFMNYFAQFVPHFSDRMKPLHDMLTGSGFNKKKTYRSQKLNIPEWDSKWGCKQIQAWKDLKTELTKPSVLVGSNPSADKRVMSDASDYELGAVLMQRDGEHWRPMAYEARKMSRSEQKYTVTERECLTVVFALKNGGTIYMAYNCSK